MAIAIISAIVIVTILFIVPIVLSCDNVDGTAEGFGDGLKGVEADGVFAALDTRDVVALIAGDVGKVLLGHAPLLAQVGDALTDTQSFLFSVHSFCTYLLVDCILFAVVTYRYFDILSIVACQ